MKILLLIAIIGAGLPLFLRNPSHCFVSSLIGLASFIALALWIRYGGHSGGNIQNIENGEEISKALGTLARSMVRFRYGTFSAILGFGIIAWAAYQWIKERTSFPNLHR